MSEKQTTIINLYGGPGTGKSTLSCELFAALKKSGHSVELVREYVKDWAWEGKKVGAFDQIYITGKQAKREYSLYGKVDYVITDSPLYLSPFYEQYYSDQNIVESSVKSFLDYSMKRGQLYLHFFIDRAKKYNPDGRYETEEQAMAIDGAMYEFMKARANLYKVPASVDIITEITDKERKDYLSRKIPFHTVS